MTEEEMEDNRPVDLTEAFGIEKERVAVFTVPQYQKDIIRDLIKSLEGDDDTND